MILKIDRVYDQHFRSYYFEAENTLGKVIHEVKLSDGKSVWKNAQSIGLFHLFVCLFIYLFICNSHWNIIDFSFDVEVATVRLR